MTITAEHSTALHAVSIPVDTQAYVPTGPQTTGGSEHTAAPDYIQWEVSHWWAKRGVRFASFSEYLYAQAWAWYYVPLVAEDDREPVEPEFYPPEAMNRVVTAIRAEPWWTPPLSDEQQQAANSDVERIQARGDEGAFYDQMEGRDSQWSLAEDTLRMARMTNGEVTTEVAHLHAWPWLWPWKPSGYYGEGVSNEEGELRIKQQASAEANRIYAEEQQRAEEQQLIGKAAEAAGLTGTLSGLLDTALDGTKTKEEQRAAGEAYDALWHLLRSAAETTAPDGPGTTQQEDAGMAIGVQAPEGTAALLALKLRLFTEDEFDSRPPPEWLIAGVLPKRSLTYVVGEPGDGKTFVTLDLAYRLASGQPWWGHSTKQVEHVLYIAAEDAVGMQMRARAWRSRFHGNERTGRVSFLAYAPQLGDPDDLHALVALVAELNPGVVVVDTQHRVTAGFDENSSRDMGVVLRFAARLQEAGSSVILVHHPSRGGKAPRGSSSQEGAADVVVFVSKDEDDGTITVRNTKQKNAPEFGSLTLRLQAEGDSAVLVEATPATWLAELTVVGWMNELGLPLTAGYDKAKAALETAGHEQVRKRTLEGALKIRKNPKTAPGV